MRSLDRVVQRRDAGGDKLPALFPTFEQNGIGLRRGNLHMIAATPGSGKTALAMTIAMRLRPLPVLYIVPDSDAQTIAARYLQQSMKWPLKRAEEALEYNPTWSATRLQGLRHVKWEFGIPTPQDINEMLQAYEEVWGVSPALTIVDNMLDIDVDQGGEMESLRKAARDLKYLAQEYDTAVLALHHTSEAVQGNPHCQPRSALWGKVAQLPALVLTLAYIPGTPDQPGTMYLCPVKNRHGWSDPSGAQTVNLTADLSTMRIWQREEQGVLHD